MTNLQIYLTVGVFGGVILLIALDVIDMTVAALLGLCVLVLTGIFNGDDMVETVRIASGPIALLLRVLGWALQDLAGRIRGELAHAAGPCPGSRASPGYR